VTVDELLRAAATRRAVLYQYAIAHDAWSTQEQVLMRQGREIEAAGCHEIAVRVLRAYVAESDDPEPEEPPCN